jgi:hypothetical protein
MSSLPVTMAQNLCSLIFSSMSFLFSKVVDFLLQNEYSNIALLIIGTLLGWTTRNLFQQTQIKILEATIKLKEQEIKGLENKVKNLNDADRADAKEFSKPTRNSVPELSINLTSQEILAIIRIYEFEAENSSKESQEYSFENLMMDLNISYSEANGIIDKLRKIGLFSSPWDSIFQFPNLDRPINESKPGRLTQEGIDIAIQFQETDACKLLEEN